MIFAIFLPHLGCRQRCIYCNQDIITDRRIGDRADFIKKELSQLQPGSQVALYGGNPLGLPPEELENLLSLFDPWRSKISSFRISAKPGKITGQALETLKKHGVHVVELGIPVFNDRILHNLGRGHTVADFSRSYTLLVEEGFTVGIQVMVGLPGERARDLHKTAEKIRMLRPASLRIYPLLVLKETGLENLYAAGAFRPISLEEAVDRVLFIYLNALKEKVPVIKMGLTENDVIHDSVIAGPYHPAFGSLVQARAFYLSVMASCERFSLSGEVTLMLNRSDIPRLVGHGRSNLHQFNEKGITVGWEVGDVKEGNYILKNGSREIEASIVDALTMLPF